MNFLQKDVPAPEIERFVEVLLSVCPAVYHDEANQEPEEYMVWRDMSEDGLKADDSEAETSYRIAVDFYTRKEFSNVPKRLKQACDREGYAYERFERNYFEGIKMTQYSTTVEVT